MSTAVAEVRAVEPGSAPIIALDVQHVAKRFGGLVAISDLTFQVPEGSEFRQVLHISPAHAPASLPLRM
jgi:ABC-type uncharacterized transport system ATPase subunit